MWGDITDMFTEQEINQLLLFLVKQAAKNKVANYKEFRTLLVEYKGASEDPKKENFIPRLWLANYTHQRLIFIINSNFW